MTKVILKYRIELTFTLNIFDMARCQDKNCRQGQGDREYQEENQGRKRRRHPQRVPTPLPADEPAPEVEEHVVDSAAESVATESVAGDVGVMN